MGRIVDDAFYSAYYGDQIDLLLAAMAQANPLPSGTNWVAFIDDCRAAQNAAETAQVAAEAAATQAETWSARPPYIGENGNWFVYSASQSDYVDSGFPSRGAKGETGENGTDGIDGVSPSVSFEQISSGTRMTVSDADHPTGQSVDIMNGADGNDGADGEDGADGISPTVSIVTIPAGHRVTITSAEHPEGQSFDVLDGSGAGDMRAAVYDPKSAVANAGGISAYILAQIAAKQAEPFTVTLPSSGWADGVQTAQDARFLANGYAYVVSPANESNIAYTSAMIYSDDVTIDGSMVFHAAETPATGLTVNVLRIEVGANEQNL